MNSENTGRRMILGEEWGKCGAGPFLPYPPAIFRVHGRIQEGYDILSIKKRETEREFQFFPNKW